MNRTLTLFFFAVTLCWENSCAQSSTPDVTTIYSSESLKIERISENVFIHVSYLQTEDFGNVACNGLVYREDSLCVVVDTPTTDSVATELLFWIENTLKSEVVGVIPTHFHDDCLGGLSEFHRNTIPSYASELTKELAKANDLPIPQNTFFGLFSVPVSKESVWLQYPGAGHTQDNIIVFIPSQKILFGGCLIKAIGSSKGFLGDADTLAWPQSVITLKENYPETKIVVPGHGSVGGTELLDYTIQLFSNK